MAVNTFIIVKVFINRQFFFTDSTKDGEFIKFCLFPRLDTMVLAFNMTFITRIIFVAAFKFNRNNITPKQKKEKK